MSANDRQVGGNHYAKDGEQHWDRMFRLYGRGYFVGCATKYIERYHLKNGKQDLEKAIHFIQKLIELEYPVEFTASTPIPGFGYGPGIERFQKEFNRLAKTLVDDAEPRSQGYVNQDGPQSPIK